MWSSRRPHSKQEPLNYNVKLALFWSVFETASMSVRSGDILSAYIYLITMKNSTVGFVQGVNGIMQMVMAIPAGWVADKYRRDRILRLAALSGLIAGIFYAVTLAEHLPTVCLFLSMGLMGSYRGLYTPPVEAIFADSIPTGTSAPYTWRYVATNIASCCSPLLSIVMFLHFGNVWAAAACQKVLLAGLTLMLAPLATMCFFSDDQTLGLRSEAVTPSPSSQNLLSSSTKELKAEEVEEEGGCGCCGVLCSPQLAVPVLITTSDFISSLASGMTVKFFSLFFMQQCGMKPVYVSLISVVSPLTISSLSMCCQRICPWVGRLQISLFTRLLDIALLVAMAYLPTGAGREREVLVAIHLLRTSFANCTRPLIRSVMMEHVPKRHRAKVNALDSVRSFSWSGSAAAGGLLIEYFGFQNTFLITAAAKLAAYLPLLPLLWFVDEGMCRCSERQAPEILPSIANGHVEGGDSGLHAPLLQSMREDCQEQPQEIAVDVCSDDEEHTLT